ncbi:hypothetical protein OC846_004349 [Tilletia horrida]|uniref:Uncharacterized protein n=1 Tax=Tilletia horrida TaxID=155126 RepID=A0AAN6GPU7_9BASI|nr:hypothetical protein OC845_004401 [Tilletia horrida]KAK0548775.1 hypothetical protein OC846_004349 [Tilletia horrida]KAK0568042.1 hypothetical protein OC861_002358 [Tilletia horrida]
MSSSSGPERAGSGSARDEPGRSTDGAAAAAAVGERGTGQPSQRPLSLFLPGASLDLSGSLFNPAAPGNSSSAGIEDEIADSATITSSFASRQRVPTSASSSNFLLPPMPSTSGRPARPTRPPPPPPVPAHPASLPATPNLGTSSNRAAPTLPPLRTSSNTPSATSMSSAIGIHNSMRQSSDSASRSSSTPLNSPAPLPLLMVSNALRAEGRPSSDPNQLPRNSLSKQSNGKSSQLDSSHSFSFTRVAPSVSLQVFPVAENITMFGSTQTTSNYSVSGKVVLTINPIAHLGASSSRHISTDVDFVASPVSASNPMLSSAATASPSSAAPSATNLSPAYQRHRTRSPSPLVRSSESESTEGVDDSSVQQESMLSSIEGAASAEEREGHVSPAAPTLRVTSLKAAFRGYALYMDHTARFSALRLADVEQECLPEGAVLPIPIEPPQGAAASAPPPKTHKKYEIEFDLSVPGWLPASLRSRFGGNFYCVSAVAKLEDGRVIRSAGSMESGRSQHTSALADGEVSAASDVQRDEAREEAATPTTATELFSPEQIDGLPSGSRAAQYSREGEEHQSDGLPLPSSNSTNTIVAGKNPTEHLSAPPSPSPSGQRRASGVSLRERVEFPLPPPPPSAEGQQTTANPGTASSRSQSTRPVSYAPGSASSVVDYDRELPPIVGAHGSGSSRPSGLPVSASAGLLDVGGAASKSANAERSNPRPTSMLPPAREPSSSSSSSGIQRLKSFRQMRNSTAPSSPQMHASPSDLSVPLPALPPSSFATDSDGGVGAASSTKPSSLLSPDSSTTAAQDQSTSSGSSGSKKPTKARTSWLSKRAKQLSLHSSSSSSSTNKANEADTSASTDAEPLTAVPSTSRRGAGGVGGSSGPAHRAGMSAPPDQTTFSGSGSRSSGLTGERESSAGDTSRGGASGRPVLTLQTGTASQPREEGQRVRHTEPLVKVQGDGSIVLKSDPRVIVIRRCRDVVPIPVARVALPGVDALPMDMSQRDASPAGGQPSTSTGTAQSGAEPRAHRSELLATTPHHSSGARAAIIDESEHSATPGGTMEPEADLHPLERRERERAEMLEEDDAMDDGDGVLAPTSTSTATPNGRMEGGAGPVSGTATPSTNPAQTQDGAAEERNSALPMLPPAPSALSAPTDPHKLAAMVTAARNAASNGDSRSSSRRTGGASGSGAHRSGGTHGRHTHHSTSGTGNGGAPMRHFLHRPVLHAPAESNIEGDGLPFALTLSLPSHVHVEGASSDMLTFGLQIEVGRSSGWSKVRELGGLRLRDMELVCLQTERHSSAASRTFCNAFALPTHPQIGAEDIPILPDPSAGARKPYPASEHRLRQGYDRDLLENHIRMAKTGNVPNPRENNVERSRTTIVGPPPLAPKSEGDEGNTEGNANEGSSKGKDRKGKKASRGDGQPKSKKESRKSLSAAQVPDANEAQNGAASSTATPNNDGSQTTPVSSGSSKPLSRGRRAYANAMNRLSHFASAMLDSGNDSDQGGTNYEPGHGNGAAASTSANRAASSSHRRDKESSADQQRATYNFSGEDGNGVDLTKGRVRMTINLPLVPSGAERAREMGAVQLIPDYESPYVRIRHKLKVKLGFGFGGSPLGGEGWWGQALVMCVPVRFTDSPPAETRQPPPTVTIAQRSSESQSNGNASAASGSLDPIIETISSSIPVLPAYTQLFREDGSRLGDEGEDLPRYPGAPEGFVSVTRNGTETDANNIRNRRPSVLRHQRGSITGPQMIPSDEADGPLSNRIVPSRVVDEAAPNNGIDPQAQAAAAREIAEMSDVGDMVDEDSESEQEDTENDGEAEGSTGANGIDASDGDVEVDRPSLDGLVADSQKLSIGQATSSQSSLAEQKQITSSHAVELQAGTERERDVEEIGGEKGKGVAHFHLRASDADGHRSTASSSPEQYHGKESKWAMTSQADDLQTPKLEQDAHVSEE